MADATLPRNGGDDRVLDLHVCRRGDRRLEKTMSALHINTVNESLATRHSLKDQDIRAMVVYHLGSIVGTSTNDKLA